MLAGVCPTKLIQFERYRTAYTTIANFVNQCSVSPHTRAMALDANEKEAAHRLSTLKSTGGALLATTLILVTVWAFQTARRAHRDLLHRTEDTRLRDAAQNTTTVLLTHTTNTMREFVSNMRCSLHEKTTATSAFLIVVTADVRAHVHAGALGAKSILYEGTILRAVRTLLKSGHDVLYSSPTTFWCIAPDMSFRTNKADLTMLHGTEPNKVDASIYYVRSNARTIALFDALIVTGNSDPSEAFNQLLNCQYNNECHWDGGIVSVSYLEFHLYPTYCSILDGVLFEKIPLLQVRRNCTGNKFVALSFDCVDGTAKEKRKQMRKRGAWLWDEDSLTCQSS